MPATTLARTPDTMFAELLNTVTKEDFQNVRESLAFTRKRDVGIWCNGSIVEAAA